MGSLFSKPKMPDPVPMPVIPEPKPMPLPDDEAMRKKNRESLREQRKRAGVASTILTSEDKLG